MKKILFLGAFLLTAGCQSTTLLRVNFDADTSGSPPSATQAVGSVSVQPGSGSVIVAEVVPGSGLVTVDAGHPKPAQKWVMIEHPTQPSPETVMVAKFAQIKGDGKYSFTAAMYIPSTTTGLSTVQFEGPGGARFLHLDFMPAGHVRINDGPTTFGSYPKDAVFLLSAHFNIQAAGATAEVHLSTGGASGSHTVNITGPQLNAARKWAAVRLWMGYQWTGRFYADDIVVKWNPS